MTSEPSLCVTGPTFGWGQRQVVASLPTSMRDSGARAGDREFSFGRFRLLPAARVLLRDGVAVPLGSRAFDLLHALLLSRGRVLSTPDIVRSVWPVTTVDECNVRFQVACLRKALGESRDLIKTVPGRGYVLVEETPATVACDPPLPDRARTFAAGTGLRPLIAEGLLRAATPPGPPEDLAEHLEALQDLLRSALDELRRMSLRGQPELAGQRTGHGVVEERTFAPRAARRALGHRL